MHIAFAARKLRWWLHFGLYRLPSLIVCRRLVSVHGVQTYATVFGIRRFSYLGKHGHHRCHECHDMDERKQQYLAVRIRSCPPQCQLFNVTGFLIFPAARQQTTRVAPQNRKLNSCGSVVFVAALGQSRDGSGSFFADGEIAWWCGENAHRIW